MVRQRAYVLFGKIIENPVDFLHNRRKAAKKNFDLNDASSRGERSGLEGPFGMMQNDYGFTWKDSPTQIMKPSYSIHACPE